MKVTKEVNMMEISRRILDNIVANGQFGHTGGLIFCSELNENRKYFHDRYRRLCASEKYSKYCKYYPSKGSSSMIFISYIGERPKSIFRNGVETPNTNGTLKKYREDVYYLNGGYSQ